MGTAAITNHVPCRSGSPHGVRGTGHALEAVPAFEAVPVFDAAAGAFVSAALGAACFGAAGLWPSIEIAANVRHATEETTPSEIKYRRRMKVPFLNANIVGIEEDSIRRTVGQAREGGRVSGHGNRGSGC